MNAPDPDYRRREVSNKPGGDSMLRGPIGETRGDRRDITRRAVAIVVRRRLAAKRLRQTDVARWSGVSRTFIRRVLRGDACLSLFILLELSAGLRVEDDCEFLREVILQRDALRAELAAVAHAPPDPTHNSA
jgi:hypothetical protein